MLPTDFASSSWESSCVQIIPKTIQAGVNFCATAWRSEYSGAAWVMTLMLRGAQVHDLVSERDGARHVWSVPATDTAGWTAGDYAYTIRATDGTNVHEVESGRVRVTPDLAAAAAGFDGRSQNRIALEAIEAVIAKRASLDQERYRINNRELYRTPVADLIRLRAHYVALVSKEEASRNGKSLFGRQVKVVMRGMR